MDCVCCMGPRGVDSRWLEHAVHHEANDKAQQQADYGEHQIVFVHDSWGFATQQSSTAREAVRVAPHY